MPQELILPGEDAEGASARLRPTKIVQHFPGPALLVGADGSVVANNDAGNGLAAGLLLGDLPDLAHAVARTISSGLAGSERVEIIGPEGGSALIVSLLPLNGDLGAQVLVLGRDVTLERNLSKALLDSRQRYKDLVSCSTDFAWETNAFGRFGFVSPRGALGYQAFELEGRSAREFKAESSDLPPELAVPKEAAGPTHPPATWPFEASQILDSVEVWLTRKDGTIGCYEVSSLPIAASGGDWVGARGVCRDVTEARRRDAELKRAYARLERLSRTDGLTGLLNRRAFHEGLETRIQHFRRHPGQGALLYVDLDNFKAVNDVKGHAAGDAALRQLSEYLTSTSRADDLVARLGGDEFALWLEDTNIDGARAKAQAIVAFGPEIHALYGVEGRPLGVSCGVVLSSPKVDVNADTLLARADEAMYHAKRAGKGRATVTLLDDQKTDADA